MPQLVSIILEAGAASNLIEDYAACLETRAEESQAPENPDEDIGSLILRVCLRISIYLQNFISSHSHLGIN
jgi:nuclear pore complex protein Nup205